MKKGEIRVRTSRRLEFVDITGELAQAVESAGAEDGVLFVFNPHTTAAVTINEGADPAVRRDLLAALEQMVPAVDFQHLEGNSPAHLMASLVGASATVFISGGRLQLGTWQKIFFCEFDGPRNRRICWKIAS